MAVHEWTVAGGLIETDAGVLLVRNVRRGGSEDWSTPGTRATFGRRSAMIWSTERVRSWRGLRSTPIRPWFS